jgi:DNA replication protein DnaC
MSEQQISDCETCGTPFPAIERSNIIPKHINIPHICKSCLDAETAKERKAESDAREREAAAKREVAWLQYCPPLYRDTDPSRISSAAHTAAMEWDPSKTMGIGFIGESGHGKTRAAFLALQKAHKAGKSVASVWHIPLSEMFQKASFTHDKASIDEIYRFHKCQVLLLDDLGKGVSTERSDAELYWLIEHRCQQMLPTIWTVNAGLDWLATKFGPDRGEPIIRRLVEFSTIVKI